MRRHSSGVPGRHEVDDARELNYRFLSNVLADVGLTGVIAHQSIPTAGRDPVEAMSRAMRLLDDG